MNAGLQPQECDALRMGIIGQMTQHQSSKTQAAKLLADIHALELTVFTAKQLDTATGDRHTIRAQHKEGHRLGQQPLNAQTMAAFAWVERLKLRLKLADQNDRI